MLKKNLKISKDYFSLVKFKNKYLLLFIIIDFINVLISLLIPYFISKIVEYLTINLYNVALICVLALAITYLFNKICSYYTNWCYANFFKKVYVEVHDKLVKSIYNFCIDYQKQIPIGKIVNSSNEDIINIAEIPSFVFELLIEIIKLLIIYFIFIKYSFWISFYVAFIDFMYYYFSSKLNDKNILYLKKQRKYADLITSFLSQILVGLKDIKCNYFFDKLNDKLNNYRRKWQVNYFLKRKYYFTRKTILGLIIDLGKIILYFLLILFLINGKLTITAFLLIISYYDKSKESINNIINFDISIRQESVSLYRIQEIISFGNKNVNLFRKIDYGINFGKIEFKNVNFKYETTLVLKDLSFKIEPNKITSIVGKNGSGKSTIFNLLLRLYQVNEGNILIDDIDIYKYSEEFFKNNISIVNQKPFLFNMSIRENLSLIDANKKRQIDVCKKVGIRDFIMSLPNGYNTLIKEDGNNLSGGQKELITLARALLKKSKILLLDEISSSLDSNALNNVINLLNELKVNHTIVVITHEKRLMNISDKIIVLDNGNIVDIVENNNLSNI